MNIKYQKARLEDIPYMQELVKEEVETGVILERTSDEIATNIRSYFIVLQDSTIIGFGALHIHTDSLAEIRSLVVDKKLRGNKIGENLVDILLEEGIRLGVKRVLCLTYKPSFFNRLGFEEISKELVPEQKIWTDCIKCKSFPVCNEVFLIKIL